MSSDNELSKAIGIWASGNLGALSFPVKGLVYYLAASRNGVSLEVPRNGSMISFAEVSPVGFPA